MKHITRSKTIWGVVVTLLAATLPKLGVKIGPSEVADFMEAFVAAAGAALAVYGRVTAKEGIHL